MVNSQNAMTDDDQLVSELWAWDVRFLMGRPLTPKPTLDPAHLIASLAQSRDARVRLSLIPLFLRHPEFAPEAEKADKSIPSQSGRIVLRFYYTAAVILQRKYSERLRQVFSRQVQLPDLFSNKLDVSLSKNPDEDLRELAKRHQALSGQTINWLGTYEHAAEVWLKQMEVQKMLHPDILAHLQESKP